MLAIYPLKNGDGPPLVFLHGFLGTSADWAAVVSELPFHCVGVDLPGHGNSPFTPDFCGALFEATEDLPPFHLIGYSMGGRLALQFAAAHPEKVLSLFLFSAHLGLKTSEERKLRVEKDRAVAQKILEMPIDEFLVHWYDQPLFKPLVSKMDIRSMRRDQNREELSKAMQAFSLGHQPDFLSALPNNTRLFAGELDEAYRANYRDIPHQIIEGAGHAVHLENPNAVRAAIQRSLE